MAVDAYDCRKAQSDTFLHDASKGIDFVHVAVQPYPVLPDNCFTVPTSKLTALSLISMSVQGDLKVLMTVSKVSSDTSWAQSRGLLIQPFCIAAQPWPENIASF